MDAAMMWISDSASAPLAAVLLLLQLLGWPSGPTPPQEAPRLMPLRRAGALVFRLVLQQLDDGQVPAALCLRQPSKSGDNDAPGQSAA